MCFDSCECAPSEADVPPQTGAELVDAIMQRKVELALELLARPVHDSTLNSMWEHTGSKYTLLQLALSSGLRVSS